MTAWGVPGVGQSSWGPAVYGIVEGPGRAVALGGRLRERLAGRGLVFEGGFSRVRSPARPRGDPPGRPRLTVHLGLYTGALSLP